MAVMSKKILLAIGQLSGGGAERVVSVWANLLCKCGYDVSILVLHREQDEYLVDNAVRVIAVKPTREEYLRMSFLARYMNMRHILKEIAPDYVISFLPTMQIWMMLVSVGMKHRRIETIRINPWRAHLRGRLGSFLWHKCYDTAYKIVLQATDQKDFYSVENQEKCVLIPNTLSPLYLGHYKSAISKCATKFIAVGRIDPQKNYPLLIQAFALVCKKQPELHLRIFGRGAETYVKHIESLIASLGMQNNIFLMGRTAHIEEEYKKSDVFLMTSDYEGLPNALMEAMASRLVCISTDCKTGPKDLIVDGETGFLIPVGNVGQCAAAIERTQSMGTAEREIMGNAARQFILDYCSEEHSTAKLVKLLS